MISPVLVNWIRRTELEIAIPYLRPGARILEIGGGTGQQALDLQRRGYDIASIDLPDSTYSEARIFPIIEYDGTSIPFPDASFDIVFSSNTLEHVPDLRSLHLEMARVLRPGGYCIHILPTGSWQFWTLITGFPTALRMILQARSGRALARGLYALARSFLPTRHGERGFALLEIWLFRPGWWRRHFAAHGLELLEDRPLGLFYTGYGFFGASWTFERRRKLARFLGSSTHMFVLRPKRTLSTEKEED